MTGRFYRPLALAGYALFYFLLDFQYRILRTDDFAYIRSVLGTLERGRLYTYEYLAPYSATLSAACALTYRLTGDFYLSTFGILALSALIAFVLLQRLLGKSLSQGQAALLAFAFATMPMFQVKASDFHGSMPNLALVLAALILFEAGSTAWFFIFAFLAFANRQSHIVLLILPLWQFVIRWRAHRPEWRIVFYSLAFASAALALHLSLNKTYSQAHAISIATGAGERIQVAVEAAMAGAFITLGALSLFGLLFRSPLIALTENLRKWIRPLCASGLLVVFTCFFWRANLICNDTTFFGLLRWDFLNRWLPWALLLSLWFLDYRLLHPTPYLTLAAGFILITSLRGMWWDYYFLEILVLCLLTAASAGPGIDMRVSSGRNWVLGSLILVNVFYGYLLRINADKQSLAVSLYENMERQGRITPDLMTSAPFGYLGWKLYDHYITHEGREFSEVAGFMGYVGKNGVVVETQLPWRRAYKSEVPVQARVLENGTRRVGFFDLPYRVVDLGGNSSGTSWNGHAYRLEGASYLSRPFPLTNSGWKVLIDSLRSKNAGPRVL